MHCRRRPACSPRRQTTICGLIASGLLLFGLLAVAVSPSRVEAAGSRYFPETGHNVPDLFANYWTANGGLDRFGLPLTEPFQQNGLMVQYFERARFERHPEFRDTAFEVLLGQVGRESRPADAPMTPRAGANTRYFPETGHSLGAFRAYWEANDGLVAFGLPLSEERQEVSAADGAMYTVQYFERARLEYHPERMGSRYEVQLGQLGAERYRVVRQVDRVADEAGAPTPPPVIAAAPATGIEMLMWQTINAERIRVGVPPLAFDPLISKAAAIHVADMTANDFIEHSGSDGSRPIDRMRRVGVQTQWASENIAMECSKDPATAVKNIQAWMLAEPLAEGVYNHHWNLVYKGYTRIGIAFGVAKNGCWMMAQNFADGEPTPGSQR